ncbi:hypothetical protein DICSQDRAFT_128371 [Dichomitus squalens LYAD-421 SS1]|uniref:Uncharacterized protein n=1 Tax=Dichomitus squalens (strain LYAD-421) TaxID=732165 RepID=R7STH0_DICSQ|nr:uncharacterized protein DICSQDRAFT_128371 [Dichomitus squalens LYAD-421 SS1]EJF59366.1 hypothetical protein DICSQDRAFT_128371 [Dichomitus squalens LYAD-421 SS1]
MACILKPTMPTSCSPELYGMEVCLVSVKVACPTMINVHEWLMIHHTIISSTGCPGGKYDVFAVAEFPIFASKAEYISMSIGIPLGPVTVEFATTLDIRQGCSSHLDKVTANIKYPLLASVKGGAFKGNLHNSCGITMSIGVPEIYGSVRLWIDCDSLWIDFDLTVFGVPYKGKFAVLPIPRWFIAVANSDKLLDAPTGKISPLPSPGAINVNNETNNITNIVTAPASGAAVAVA